MTDVQSGYLQSVFDSKRFGKTVDRAKRTMLAICDRVPVDAIAFTGVSGAAMGFILGEAFKLPIVCVRKTSERTHTYSLTEGELGPLNYLIVDDFPETGETIKVIAEKLQSTGYGCSVSGVLFYQREWRWDSLCGWMPDFNGRLLPDIICECNPAKPWRDDLPKCPAFGLLP